ncbi:MAG: hypothetical protein KC464_18260, partial [Myxococcales bacterium]|nr:hypothetical protein [Myxococcales bacterium]
MRVHYRNGDAQLVAGDGIARLSGMADYTEMQVALRKYLGELRGFDIVHGKRVPRTLNADVQQLAAIWDRAMSRARMDVFGMKGALARWQATAAEIAALTSSSDPTAVYENNARFWDTTNRIAIRLQVAAEEPPDLTLTDALVDNLKALPDRVATAAGWLLDAAGDAASSAADLAGEAAAGAGTAAARGLSPIFRPLLIGAGLFGGGYLLTRAM